MRKSIPNFTFLTGDFIRQSNRESFDKFQEEMLQFDTPYYLAMGNHDDSELVRRFFQEEWGGSWYSREHGDNLLVFLNSELERYDLVDEQIDFLRNRMHGEVQADNVFVFLHHLLWLNHSPSNIPLDNQGHPYFENQFWKVVFPILSNSGKDVFVIAGDVGAFPDRNATFYEKIGKVTLIASGVGENGDKENFLVVDGHANGEVEMRFKFLADGSEVPVQSLANHFLTESETQKKWRESPAINFIKSVMVPVKQFVKDVIIFLGI